MIDRRNRRRLGALATVVGLASAIAVAFLYFVGAQQTVGDLQSVESSLAGKIMLPPSAPDSEALARQQSPVPQGETPLWQSNPQTSLGALGPGPAPVGLIIERLEVVARIDPYGINKETGQMAVPNNVTDVAWYKHGPRPGDAGSAVLAAHVDLQGQGPGVFFELKSLEPGDRIGVEYDDSSFRQFVVVARTEYEKEELPLDLIFSREGEPILTLVTCGGGFDDSLARYDSNVVVYAIPIPIDAGNLVGGL